MAEGATNYGGGATGQDINQQVPPPANEVMHFHINSDVDTSNQALHHTLGGYPGQAAAGTHTHNGTDSPLLLDSFVLTGSKTDGTAWNSIINCLVRLGATDQTT